MEISILMWMIIILYFLPTVIASLRHHQQTAAIAVLNIFLGWTLLGWIAALVWSATAVQPRPARTW